MANGRHDKVQLGCGTLILIALIVVVFSGRGDIDNLRSEIEMLQQEVSVLGEKVDALTRAIEGSPSGEERIETGESEQAGMGDNPLNPGITDGGDAAPGSRQESASEE